MSDERRPLLDRLDAIGLPHALPLREAIERWGLVTSTYYNWPVVRFEGLPPFLEGQVQAFESQVLGGPFAPDLLAPAYFDTFVAVSTDARTNHAHARRALAQSFGASRDTGSSNTLGDEWTFDTGLVRLQTWPADMERHRMTNPAHERHPEMRAFTHLTIHAGHVPELADDEREALRTVVPFEHGPLVTISIPGAIDNPMVLGTARRVPPELRRPEAIVGTGGPFETIVGMNGASAFVLPLQHVRELRLLRAHPARGRGYAQLTVRYRDVWCSREQLRTRVLLRGGGPNDLDAPTRLVETRLGMSATIEDFDDD